MNQQPTPDSPLDRLLDALRSAPSTEELSGEATAIQAMASAIAEASTGDISMTASSRTPSTRPTMTRRARRVVILTTVGVLGVAGVAAAGKGSFIPHDRPTLEATLDTDDSDDTVSETSVVDTTIVDTTIVDTTAADDQGDDEGDEATDATDATNPDDSAPTTSIECADGNHGKTVSSVAHETPPGPGHGEAVSAAAQSDCGKKDATEDTSVDTTAPGDTTPDATTADTETKENGNGHGNVPSDPGSQGHRPSDPGNPGHGHGG